jgi:hypothetical protein
MITRMIRFSPSRQQEFPPAAFVALFLALCVFAPPPARGGCSHLVTSRGEHARQPSVLDALIVDVLGGESGRSDAPSVPPPSRPCTGAWCSGQPAAPVAPPETSARQLEAWAWHEAVTGPKAVISSCISTDENDHRPQLQPGFIFRPPRLVPSASTN